MVENKSLKEEITSLKNIIVMQEGKLLIANDQEQQKYLFEIQFRKKLSNMFSPTQIDLILNQKKKFLGGQMKILLQLYL